jgi:hypothetical protein
METNIPKEVREIIKVLIDKAKGYPTGTTFYTEIGFNCVKITVTYPNDILKWKM